MEQKNSWQQDKDTWQENRKFVLEYLKSIDERLGSIEKSMVANSLEIQNLKHQTSMKQIAINVMGGFVPALIALIYFAIQLLKK